MTEVKDTYTFHLNLKIFLWSFHSWAMVEWIYLYHSTKKYCNGLIKRERFCLPPNFHLMLNFITFMAPVSTLHRVYGIFLFPFLLYSPKINKIKVGILLSWIITNLYTVCLQLWKRRLSCLGPTRITVARCNDSLPRYFTHYHLFYSLGHL